MSLNNSQQVALNNEDYFLFENGLWTGKKGQLIKCKVLRNTNFTNDGYLNLENIAEIDIQQDLLPRKQLAQGDILIERSGGGPDQPVGRVALFNLQDGEKYSFSNFTTRLRVKNSRLLSPYYLHLYLLNYYINGETEKLQKRTTGIRNLDFSNYKNLKISLLPISNQDLIVEKMRIVKEVLETRKKLFRTTLELKRTLASQFFHYGINKENRKTTKIGLLPNSWKLESFYERVEIKSGQVKPTQDLYSDMIHVGPENIVSDTGILVAEKTNKELGIKSGNYLFTEEYILYSKIRPYLNKVAMPNFSGTCSADMYPLKPNSDVLEKNFLFQFMLTDIFNNQAISFQDRTGIPKINRDQLNSIMIPLPKIEEQREIAHILDKCDAAIKLIKNEVVLLEEMFKVLLNTLLKEEVNLL